MKVNKAMSYLQVQKKGSNGANSIFDIYFVTYACSNS